MAHVGTGHEDIREGINVRNVFARCRRFEELAANHETMLKVGMRFAPCGSMDSEKEEHTPEPEEQHPIVYASAELLKGRKEVWIEHEGEMYRLRITARGRLILTK